MSARIALQLAMPPDWQQIDPVRQAIALCVEAVFGNVSYKDAIAMVSSELLENAIKYGSSGEPVRIAIEDGSDGVQVVVSNRVDDQPAVVHALRQRLEWIQRFPEPRAAYTAALEQAFATSAEGGLGLVRIAYEGWCTLGCDASVPGAITVTAHVRPRPSEAT